MVANVLVCVVGVVCVIMVVAFVGNEKEGVADLCLLEGTWLLHGVPLHSLTPTLVLVRGLRYRTVRYR